MTPEKRPSPLTSVLLILTYCERMTGKPQVILSVQTVRPSTVLRPRAYSTRRTGDAMKNETSSVTFRVPDFIDADGIEYTDIEVIVEMDGDITTPPTSLRRCSVP
jgi:hypothetical protein